MMTTSSPNPTRHDRIGGDEPAEERADGSGDRCRGADQRVGLLPGSPLEVAVDERLHGRQQEGGPEAADDRPEDDDRGQALGERHGQGADGIREQADHVGALAAHEIAHLRVDQDEGSRDQGLQGDRRLDAAGGRVQVFDHRGDRHVHERRVHDEDEHRRRQQKREPRARPALGLHCFLRFGAHAGAEPSPGALGQSGFLAHVECLAQEAG